MSLKYFGYLLITVGFLGGSFEVVKQVEGVNTSSFLVWLAIEQIGQEFQAGEQKAARRFLEMVSGFHWVNLLSFLQWVTRQKQRPMIRRRSTYTTSAIESTNGSWPTWSSS